ncbi:hypothetical protein C8J56DRAFT_1063048 [Mycena floridula]|nr:hypothetical protein C8J56DRAFT_1063048 [Mycena floridula]
MYNGWDKRQHHFQCQSLKHHLSDDSDRPAKRARVDPGSQVQQAQSYSLLDHDRHDKGVKLKIWSFPTRPVRTEVMQMMEDVFSDPAYEKNGCPFNFDVSVPQKDNCSEAWVILPYTSSLDLFFSRRAFANYPHLSFTRFESAINPPDQFLVRNLRQAPYKPVEEILAHEDKVAQLRERLPVREIHFGVWTNDSIFSSEHSVNEFPEGIDIWCDWHRRSVLLEQRVSNPSTPRHDLHQALIDVRDITASFIDGSKSLLLHMRRPVMFQQECIASEDSDRVPGFDKAHSSSQFTSSAIVIQFRDPESYHTFL